MDTTAVSSGLIFGLIAGMVVGIVPAVYGAIKGDLRTGIVAFFACTAAGAALGMLLAVPIAAVFVYRISKAAKGASAADSKPCPFCGEAIKRSAVHCRFCGADFTNAG